MTEAIELSIRPVSERRDLAGKRFPRAVLGVGLWLALGCAASPSAVEKAVRAKLALVGLATVTEQAAGIPPAERGRYIPCRVLAGDGAALPEHPAGYLLVGVGRGDAEEWNAEAIRRELYRWRPGQILKVTVRRNPFVGPPNEWWEREVHMRLPAE